MVVIDAVAKFVNFLRAGYPTGVPATDTFPVLAVLPHRPAYPELARLGSADRTTAATA